MGYSTLGTAQVSALGSSEASEVSNTLVQWKVQSGAAELSALGAVSALGRVRFRRFYCNYVSGSLCRHFSVKSSLNKVQHITRDHFCGTS